MNIFFIDYWNLKILATDKFVFPTAECNLDCDPFTSILDSNSCECVLIPSCKCWIFFIICRLLKFKSYGYWQSVFPIAQVCAIFCDPDYSTLDSDFCACISIEPCKCWVIWSQLFKIWKLSQTFSIEEDFSLLKIFLTIFYFQR